MLRYLHTQSLLEGYAARHGRCFLLAILLLATLIPISLAEASDAIGAVDNAVGECRVVRGDETLAAEKDLPIALKDEVSTGKGAELSILFADETTLSLSESSHASIDSYVYSDKSSDLLFKFTQGTFRTITGEIVKKNPEGFNMETPLASIGIRGSDVYVIAQPGGEEVGANHLGENHYVEIRTERQTAYITKSGMRVRISPDGTISPPSNIPSQGGTPPRSKSTPTSTLPSTTIIPKQPTVQHPPKLPYP